MSAGPEDSFNIFTDSQAAMTRLLNDQIGPRQDSAVRGIRLAKELTRRGATIAIRWVPGHAGVQGNEIVDMWATEAAAREDRKRTGSYGNNIRSGTRSLAFVKTRIKKRAIKEWREEIVRRSQGKDPSESRRREGYQVYLQGHEGLLRRLRLGISS